MLPNPNMARGSSWGGFGYNAPLQQVPGAPQGLPAMQGAFGNARPMQMGMGQRTLDAETAAQYRPQMMANALMAPQQPQQMGTVPAPTPPQQPPPAAWGSLPQMQNATGPQQQLGYGQASGQLGASIGQPQQPMQRPVVPPRGYTA
jgi:hypothetical protein